MFGFGCYHQILTEHIMTKTEHFKKAAEYGGIHNLTPHAITVGTTNYEPTGLVARVDTSHTEIVDGLTSVQRGKVKFYRDGEEIQLCGFDFDGTVNIVSGVVFDSVKDWKCGVWVAPATSHPDVVRNEKGQIISVPAFLI